MKANNLFDKLARFFKSLNADKIAFLLSILIIVYFLANIFYIKPHIRLIVKTAEMYTNEAKRAEIFKEKFIEFRNSNITTLGVPVVLGSLSSLILPIYFFFKNRRRFTKKWLFIIVCVGIYLLRLQIILAIFCFARYLYKEFFDPQESQLDSV